MVGKHFIRGSIYRRFGSRLVENCLNIIVMNLCFVYQLEIGLDLGGKSVSGVELIIGLILGQSRRQFSETELKKTLDRTSLFQVKYFKRSYLAD